MQLIVKRQLNKSVKNSNKMALQKIKTTEKIVRMIEAENTLVFEADLKSRKKDLKAEFEKLFNAKVISVNTQSKDNKKIVYIRLDAKFPAIDIATKLGVM